MNDKSDETTAIIQAVMAIAKKVSLSNVLSVAELRATLDTLEEIGRQVGVTELQGGPIREFFRKKKVPHLDDVILRNFGNLIGWILVLICIQKYCQKQN